MVAILHQEPSAELLVEALDSAPTIGVGAPTLLETGIVVGTRLGFDKTLLLQRFLQIFNVTVLPFTEEHWEVALAAYETYGKGRHAAALNMGDCLTYAVAKLADEPLLCIGEDFPKTDLVVTKPAS